MGNTIKIKRSILKEMIRTQVTRMLLEDMNVNVRPVTLQELNAWFDEFNQKYFNNNLPKVPIKLEPINAHTWGRFKSGQQYFTKTRKKTGPFIPEKASITINSSFNGTEYNIRNTLLHEMVHLKVAFTIDYVPTRHHGWEFMNEAYRINSLSKQTGDNFNITATNDCIENEVSDTGLELYKNRISEEYTFGLLTDGKNPYRVSYWLFRTDEKYIPYFNLTWNKNNCHIDWYKVKSSNPRLGVQQRICRSTITGKVSYVSAENVINEFKKIYPDAEFTPFVNAEPTKTSGKKYYLGIYIENNSQRYYLFKTEWKYTNGLTQRYPSRLGNFEFYPVTKYDINFDAMKESMSKIFTLSTGYSFEEALNKLQQNCSFDFEDM